jgi:hypothetical protein
MKKKNEPLERLKYHVTGAIERGEGVAIEAILPTTTHTPGPWEIFQAKGWSKGFAKQVNFEIRHVPKDKPQFHELVAITFRKASHADARLIAAAPEMLDALEAVLRELNCAADFN